MKKPTYYLWRNEFDTQEAYESTKQKYMNLGFRVVTYLEHRNGKNIHEGLKNIIKNHIYD